MISSTSTTPLAQLNLQEINLTGLRGIWRLDENLAQYTSWRVGGKAKCYYRPHDLVDLAEFLQRLPAEIPIFWLGLGSNVLIRDGGFPGVVIHTFKCMNNIEILQQSTEQQLIRIEAGVTCAKVARYCARYDLLGGEFFAGIPGTMGGALVMNAGAFGNETWRHLVAVELIDREGNIRKLSADKFKVGYRSVSMPLTAAGEPEEAWFAAGHLQFVKGDGHKAQQQIKELLAKRNNSQPIGKLSCGSVFKNPPGYYAAELIEASKLKGESRGNAVVSTKHANFIINEGKALAADIEKLIAKVQQQVWQDHGVRLETEVKIIGVEKT